MKCRNTQIDTLIHRYSDTLILLVRHLRNDLEEKVSLLAGLLKDLNTSKQEVELIERSCSSLIREQGDTLHCRDTEIQKLQEKIR